MRKYRVLGALAVLLGTVAVTLVAVASARLHHDPSDAAGPLDLSRVGVEQVRRNIELTVRTTHGFNLGALNRRPDLANKNARYLCLLIHRSGARRVRVLCFGARPKGGQDTLGSGLLSGDGSLRSWRPIKARVNRPNHRTVIVR